MALTVPWIVPPPAALIFTCDRSTTSRPARIIEHVSRRYIHPPVKRHWRRTLEREPHERVERMMVTLAEIPVILDHRLDVRPNKRAHVHDSGPEARHRGV